VKARQFVPFDEIARIGARRAKEARQAGDTAGADAVEEFVSDIQHAIEVTLWDMDPGYQNGDRK
jgi:hypothetical protein